MKELIERLEHTDELSGDSVWEVREALKTQADALERLTTQNVELTTRAVEQGKTIIALTSERDSLKEGLDGWHERYLDMAAIAGEKHD